jgi:hypothetical protein
MRGFKEYDAADRFCREYDEPRNGADRVTTDTFQQPADPVTFSITPASQWTSSKSDNQKIRPHEDTGGMLPLGLRKVPVDGRCCRLE